MLIIFIISDENICLVSTKQKNEQWFKIINGNFGIIESKNDLNKQITNVYSNLYHVSKIIDKYKSSQYTEMINVWK